MMRARHIHGLRFRLKGRGGRAWRIGALLLALLAPAAIVAAPVAHADDTSSRREQARQQFEKAQIQYKLGRFQEALDGYTRAYEIFPAPAFLFNIGQCHKNLKSYERALFFFEGYLREEKNPSKRSLAEELIAESRAKLDAERAHPAPAEPASPPAAPPAPTEPTSAATATATTAAGPAAVPMPQPTAPAGGATASSLLTPAPSESASAGEAPARTSVTQKWWFWTAVGVGLIAVAGGTIAYTSSGSTTTVPPSGTIGTLDRRP
jgi:hypothetical protein